MVRLLDGADRDLGVATKATGLSSWWSKEAETLHIEDVDDVPSADRSTGIRSRVGTGTV
jgi:hypothetical protein